MDFFLSRYLERHSRPQILIQIHFASLALTFTRSIKKYFSEKHPTFHNNHQYQITTLSSKKKSEILSERDIKNNHLKKQPASIAKDDCSDEQTSWYKLGWLSNLIIWYRRFSTAVFVYGVVKYTFSFESIFAKLGFEKPVNCYLIGRFVIHQLISNEVAILLASYQLVWRLWQFIRQPKMSNIVIFLLQSDEVVRRQYKLFNCNYIKSMRPIDYLNRGVMCYPIKEQNNETIYRLRPNRTASARNRLRKYISITNALNMAALVFLFCLISPIIFYSILSDSSYVESYPTCYPELDELYKKGSLKSFTVTINGHKLAAIIMDTIINWVFWVDSAIGLLYVGPLVYVYNFDQLIYWEHPQKELNKLLVQIKSNWIDSQNMYFDSDMNDNSVIKLTKNSLDNIEMPYKKSSKINNNINNNNSIVKQINTYDIVTNNNSNNYETTSNKLIRTNRRMSYELELENSIYEIQVQVCDFFRQLELADRIISDVITHMALIYMTVFAALFYFPVTRDLGSFSFILKFSQVIAILIYTALSLSMLILHRRVSKSYGTICSIMAYDRSRHKCRFAEILDFYTTRNRASYTLLHQYPYVLTTYLTILGWSFSCAVLIETIFKKR